MPPTGALVGHVTASSVQLMDVDWQRHDVAMFAAASLSLCQCLVLLVVAVLNDSPSSAQFENSTDAASGHGRSKFSLFDLLSSTKQNETQRTDSIRTKRKLQRLRLNLRIYRR